MNIIKRFFWPVMGCFVVLGLSLSAFSMHLDVKKYLLELISHDNISSLAHTLNEREFSGEDIREIFTKIVKENKLDLLIEQSSPNIKENLFTKLLDKLMEIAVGDSDESIID